MPVTIIIGAQWGDEGKGRFVDYFSATAQLVARYAGGDNAGHTVAVGDEVFKMHLIPSGILHPNVTAIMGNGMVINPMSLLTEMAKLRAQGVEINPNNLKISTRSHIITPAHIELDRMKEAELGDEAIGTTLKGIGPAYLDKMGRRGLRVGQMLHIEEFADALTKALDYHNQILSRNNHPIVDVAAGVQQYVEAAHQLRPFIHDTTVLLNERLQAGDHIVCEGAQGTLLDVDHGSYPFVTSSSPSIGGVLIGLGIGPAHINRIVGVAKAFSTRVGGGPMPTQTDGAVAAKLRGTGENFWDEFGTTTGRPRRCGWLDTVLLRYSAMLNGFTEMMLTKMDILTGFDELKIAVAYEIDGQRHEMPPSTIEALRRAVPIYETVSGWDEDISQAQSLSELPKAAVHYINRVSQLCNVDVKAVSVGPERHQVVKL